VIAPAYAPAFGGGPTAGPRAAALARKVFGLKVLRWQRYVLDRGLERAGDRWRWRIVVVTVARQNGKSVLLRALAADSLIAGRGQHVGALSHLRSTARETLFDPLADVLGQGTPMGELFQGKAVRANGQESLSLAATGGRLVLPSASEKGAHGLSLDLILADEIWALRDYRVQQAITPTQIARPDPQLWVVSTAGTGESLWLRELVEAGRSGATDRLALFEWSAPADDDPGDPASWAQANPALGETISTDELRTAWEVSTTPESRAEFERAHLNRWTANVEAILPAESWRRARSDLAITGDLFVGFDVALDRSQASIAAAGVVGDRVVVELIDCRPGVEWLRPAVAELLERWHPVAIVANDAGPARSACEEMIAAGLPVIPYKAGTYTAACQVFFDLVTEERLAHRGQPVLDEAARVVGRRKLGESWAFGRAVSGGDISALVAAALAAHAASRPRMVPRVQFA
jgi:hypothetical protein